MKILVTGANGFLGKNLIAELKNRNYSDIYTYDRDKDLGLLEHYCKKCDFVFHLAGVNRPENQDEFMKGNYGFTSVLLELLLKNKNKCPVMLASSIHALRGNEYGKSKKAGEELLFRYGKENGVEVMIYRFQNIFGKWCRPNYNSVIATFCYNVARNLEVHIHDSNTELELVYIDDVVEELIRALNGEPNTSQNFCSVLPVYKIKLGEIYDLLCSFKKSRENKLIPNMSVDSFSKKLYATYLTYLPEDDFKYFLEMHSNEKGSFTELLRTAERGQFSVNISRPGVTKGNHWHHSKNEKFAVVSGQAIIRFRKIGTEKIIEYHVSSKQLEVVDIPAGYTHTIINTGEQDLVTFMWCSDCYDEAHADTYFEEVDRIGKEYASE